MKELLWRIVSSLLTAFGYGKDDEEPDHNGDDPFEQFEHLWTDIGGEG